MLYRDKFKYIQSAGVELEGGISERKLKEFKALAKEKLGDRLSIGGDASVNVLPPLDIPSWDWINDVEIRFWSFDIDELLHFVELLFSLGFKQNSTCGNHHHFRFTSQLAISALASPAAYRAFIREYAKFGESRTNSHKYLSRLSNSYCKVPLGTRSLYSALFAYDRYFAINFCSIFKHKTLEVRILPHADNFDEFRTMHFWLCSTLDKIIAANIRKMSMTVSW